MTSVRVLAVALLVALSVVGSPAERVEAAPTAAPVVRVREAHEYFTTAWEDPMDMSNPEDFDTSGRRSPGISTSLSNGALHYSQWRRHGRLYFADAAPNELNVVGHRQSTNEQIRSDLYTRLAVRAYTNRASTGFIVWDHCPGPEPGQACQGTKMFKLRAGWHTYDLDLTGADDADSVTAPNLPTSISGAPWKAGGVVRLGWQPSGDGSTGIQGVIDSVRLYRPGISMVDVSNPGGTANLWHDVDANTSDNGTPGAESNEAGVLRTDLGTGTNRVDLGALVPGRYWLELERGGSFDQPAVEVVIDAAPRPRVLDPDMAGGGDWYQATRGSKMDFSQRSDLFKMFDGRWNVRNADFAVFGGMLHASSKGRFDDPQVYLSDAVWNGPMLDAKEWHRISWTIGYDGTWGTSAAPGQGLDAKFCWFPVNQSPSCSKDVFPELGPQRYSVDLKTARPADVETPGHSGRGYGGPSSRWVHLLRFDPHEDPGNRTWHLDDVRISHDDRIPFGGTFPIRFVDRAHQGGSTARIYLDGDRNRFNGSRLIATRSTVAGTNTVMVSAKGLAPGRYWVRVEVTDPSGSLRVDTSTGPLDVPVPAEWSPFGTLEAVEGRRGHFYIRGWSIDPDWVRDPTRIHLRIDGRSIDIGPASQAHMGIWGLRSDAGPWHGFDRQIPAAPGPHEVCAYAINFGYGNHTTLGCRNVVVK